MTISKYLAEQNVNFLYYPSYKYYTSEFIIHNWLSAPAMTVKYTTILAQFWIVLLVPNRSWRIYENPSDNIVTFKYDSVSLYSMCQNEIHSI